MIGRLLKGLILGVLIRGLVAAALVKGLAVTSFALASGGGVFLAFASALVTGAIVGLVAGKPIWAEGAMVEALLKTFFGALLAAGGMFALRRFVGVEVDLDRFGLGSGTIGELPVLALPAIATVLSMFYEVDNTDAPEPAAKGGRVEGKAAAKKLRAPSPSAENGAASEAEEEAAAPRKAKK